MAGVLAAVFVTLFVVGDLLSTLLTSVWLATLGPAITSVVHAVLGNGALANTVLWGVNGAMLATLAVGIPYVLTFSVILAALEDSGYMNAAAFLSDRVMRRLGLHGQAVIPLIAAAGCNVPAIFGTRVLPSMRERMIACVLVTLTPCSARTAVILGAVALYAGWQWALFVYAVVAAVGIGAALLLDHMLPGEPGPLIMEMFPLRRPSARLVFTSAWRRFREFAWVAAPIVIGGSLALGALYETGLVWYLTRPLEPVVGWWLGLPAVAGLTLIFAVLRKELALQLLVVFAVAAYGVQAHALSDFMTPHQLVVYGLVNAIYVPCVATIAALSRELGRSRAALISLGTVAVALAVGGAVAHVLPLV
jgi:ferrous iron transport protein B